MKIIAPDYYPQFKCIAELCKHNCCIGWEIDVDKDSCEYYKTIGGDFGKMLSENIELGETSCFKLGENERCPFLNKNNLCDIIINLGEDKLCQICADHPRFRNFYNDRTEVGLGLCCESAAELILNRRDKARLVILEDDECIPSEEDSRFFDFRDRIFEVLQDRSLTVDQRASFIMSTFDEPFPEKSFSEWAEIFSSLEQLDSVWSEKLKLLPNAKIVDTDEIALEQLLVYFIYRHLPDGMYDGRIKERIAFAFLSVHIIRGLLSVCDEPLTEIARMYSSEIEYSEENMESLLSVLGGA